MEQAGLEVLYAALLDQPLALEGEDGLRQWVEMYADHALSGRAPGQRQEFLRAVEEEARPVLYRGGRWFIDYRWLRVAAYRPGRPDALAGASG
jgi:hypothetical protein